MQLANKKIFKQSNPQKQTRKGDWICVSCQNYNYSFRIFCNRCRVQTRKQNDQQNAMLQMESENEKSKWQQRIPIVYEDPMQDRNFPKILLLNPAESYSPLFDYQHKRKCKQGVGQLGLHARKINQQSLVCCDTQFEIQNIKWLCRLIQQ